MTNLDVLHLMRFTTPNSELFKKLTEQSQKDIMEYIDTQIIIEKEFAE